MKYVFQLNYNTSTSYNFQLGIVKFQVCHTRGVWCGTMNKKHYRELIQTPIRVGVQECFKTSERICIRLATHAEGPTDKFSEYSTKQKSEKRLPIVITFPFNLQLFFLPSSFSFRLLPFFRAIIGRLCLTFLNFSSSVLFTSLLFCSLHELVHQLSKLA